MQAPLRDRDPQRLGPYRLTGRLGRGGMGTVFLGEDESGRQVAVKVINAELADDEAFNERFRREVTAARQVRRFCTAAVLDARLDGEPLYIVTEYVAGPSLDDAVKSGGPLRGGDLEALAVNIATALSAIHGAGIVHRDLKPSNVLLSPTGPRVIDFGIARALDSSDGPTRTGQFIGTPAYIAPELMHGEDVTPAADVFSWGCVVAYAGTGRAPFGGGTLPEIIQRVTSAEPDLDGLEPSVRDLVARSLAKDPSGRPSVKQLIRALTGEDEPPATPPTFVLPRDEAPTLTPTPDAAPRRPAPVGSTQPPGPGGSAGSPGSVGSVRPPGVSAQPPGSGRSAGAPQGTAEQPVAVTSPVNAPPSPPRARPAGRPAARRPLQHRRPLIAAFAVAAVGIPILAGVLAPGPDGMARDTDPGSGFGDKPPKVKEKILEDDFKDDASGWTKASTPSWDASYRDRKYALRVLPTTRGTVVRAPVNEVPESQLIDVKVESSEDGGGEAGVYCHGQSAGFAFLLRADGRARIAKMYDLALVDLATGTATQLRNNENRIQAACEEDGSQVNLGLWVNGQAVATTTFPAPDEETGTSGLIVSRSEGATGHPEATFDDFSLCEV
ncbi:serine/threonine-protein kinase [Actinomadura sp. KC06]|uniref:serine/threonine-protein kinase n=1 Tax=Actinomadura sp. KC06 TaxID=2530369 RepID=UPI001FB73214|nr:serine/threonine-protein kinase [Actinomadura sp. KC06]